jgi:phage terminase large subunit
MLTGILAQRLRDGKWVQAEGVVFSEFDQENMTDAEPDPKLPIELAVDDGYIDPRAILFIQRTADRILVFDELYHSHHLPEVCVGEVLDLCAKRGVPRPEIAIIPTEAVTLRERLRAADIPARPGTHKIVYGIAAMRSHILDGNGHRTLQVNRRCRNLLNELTSGYKYPEAGSRRDTEVPIDKDNHAVDALRYWVWVRARR